MAGAAMAEAFDEIGTAIPDRRLARIGLERLGLMEQRIPSGYQRTKIERKTKRVLRRLGAHWRLRHQIGVERLQVGFAGPGKVRIGKRGIEMPAVAMNAFAHG